MCKLFTKDTGGLFSVEVRHDLKDARDNRLSNCEQWFAWVVPAIVSLGRTSATVLRMSDHLLLTLQGSNGNSTVPYASLQRPAAGDCRARDRRSGRPQAFWFSPRRSFQRNRPRRRREERSS
jgi:hypothetical protein